MMLHLGRPGKGIQHCLGGMLIRCCIVVPLWRSLGVQLVKAKIQKTSFFVPTVLSAIRENFAAINVNIPTYAPPQSPSQNTMTKSQQPLLLQMGPTLPKKTESLPLLPTPIEPAVLREYLKGCDMWLPKMVSQMHNLY